MREICLPEMALQNANQLGESVRAAIRVWGDYSTLVIVFCTVFSLFIIIVVLSGRILRRRERERRRKLKAFADKLGLEFSLKDPLSMLVRYKDVDSLRIRGNHKLFNVIRGSFKGLDVALFDHKCEMYGYGGVGAIWNYTRCAIFAGMKLPRLNLRSQGIMDKIGDIGESKDVDVELGDWDFDGKYYVRSDDEAFAREVLGEVMRDYLLGVFPIQVETGGDMLLVSSEKRLRPEEMEDLLETALGVFERMPKKAAEEP